MRKIERKNKRIVSTKFEIIVTFSGEAREYREEYMGV